MAGLNFSPASITRAFIAPKAHTKLTRTQASAAASHAGGFQPGWRWVPPPGIGDAPQLVYTTFTLIPLDIKGPGDNPATYLRSWMQPTFAGFAMRQQGIPVQGGAFLMTGLYTPEPMGSPANSQF